MLGSKPSSGWNAEQENLLLHYKCTLGRKKNPVATMSVTHKPIAITSITSKISSIVATPRKYRAIASTVQKIPAAQRMLHLLVFEGVLDVNRLVLHQRQQPIKLLLIQLLNKQRRTLLLNPRPPTQ